MTARTPLRRFMAGLLLAVAALAWAPRATSDEPVETALTLSMDAPARLVLAYWPSGGWQVRQSGRQVELVLPGAGLAISSATVALPTGDGAIMSLATGMSEGAAYLRIGLGCDCTLAVWGDGDRLVIDVVGAGRVAGPVYRDPGPAPRLAPPPAARPARLGVAAGVSDEQRVENTRTRLLEELRQAAETGLITLRPDADGALAQARDQAPAADRGAGESAGDATGDAAEDTPGDAPGEVHPGAPAAHAATPAAPDRPAGPQLPPGASARIAPEPPLASAAADRPADLVAAVPAPACFGNDAFRLADPMPADALVAELSRLRRALVGEFDKVDSAAALALARLYLAHGLGVETLGILAEFAPDAPETGLLAALAWLAEGRPLPEPNILAVSGCTGQHALWQALDAALGGVPPRRWSARWRRPARWSRRRAECAAGSPSGSGSRQPPSTTGSPPTG